MKHFAKSVLNYFAAFSETRFRFSTKRLAYQWADEQQHSLDVLDLAVFPEVQQQILDAVALNQPLRVTVRKNEYAIRLDSKPLVHRLITWLDPERSTQVLEALLVAHGFYSPEIVLPAGQKPKDLFEQPIDRRKSWLEACREFNLKVRKEYWAGLLAIQQDKMDELRTRLRLVNAFPRVSLNARQAEQQFFNDLQEIAAHNDPKESAQVIPTPGAAARHITAVATHISDTIADFVLFDLCMILSAYRQSVGSQTTYMFFHDIGREGQSRYPLFCAEIEISGTTDQVTLTSSGDAFMLNTPAINTFEFSSVLTTQRACPFSEAMESLKTIEQFLQAHYNLPTQFILQRGFRPLLADNLPEIRFRVALQAVSEEDRRILDYSHLLSTLDGGAGQKFMDLIGSYVQGNVKSTAQDVERSFKEQYPPRSVNSLIHPNSLIPLSINEAQKRILLAAENSKNRIIVIDGPPGTGKSYTITALIYQASLQGKSVLVTSHKQQALNVIDDFLTAQFRQLHPRGKPPVLRLSTTTGPRSPNDLENTLATAAISASLHRVREGNTDAVTRDRGRILDKITGNLATFWNTSEEYTERVRDLHELARLHEDLLPNTPMEESFGGNEGGTFAMHDIARLSETFARLDGPVSLNLLVALEKSREMIPTALEHCHRLHDLQQQIKPDILTKNPLVPPTIERFARMVETLTPALVSKACLADIDAVDAAFVASSLVDITGIDTHAALNQLRDHVEALVNARSKFLASWFRKRELATLTAQIHTACPSVAAQCDADPAALLTTLQVYLSQIDTATKQAPCLAPDFLVGRYRTLTWAKVVTTAKELSGLDLHDVHAVIEVLAGVDYRQCSIGDLQTLSRQLLILKEHQGSAASLQSFASTVELGTEDVPALYSFLNQATTFMAEFQPQDMTLLQCLAAGHPHLFAAMGVSMEDLRTFSVLAPATERGRKALRFIELRALLRVTPALRPPSEPDMADFKGKTQKLLTHQMDTRFKNLQDFPGEVSRILIAVKSGKRISEEQARVLFSCIGCVIADPSLISRHFPMKEDMVDYLIIDEASQVSIAESISLILRAKQTIVFGDDLQYGAVGAVNISERYAGQYFKEILRNYAHDMNQAMSEEETDRIALEVSKAVTDEDEEASVAYNPDPATKEWLKTFGVRTSTLSFAKALKNYSDSLNVHFRSFPEIISYSNEYFYRVSQIDLITNRIRTKPMGDVLRFIQVETKGHSGKNVNLDEIEAIRDDIKRLMDSGFKGTIGVICSFKEQTARMEELLRKELDCFPDLERNHRFQIWFVGDVQGEERDLIYYSFVQDKKLGNADLRTIYPIIGGTADNIRRLKMQRLNVGFSRAKDTMVFVHSMPISDYSDSRLGNALKHYTGLLSASHDNYISDESIFESPAERMLYSLLTQTPFMQRHRENCRLLAQFEIGKYIREEFKRYIPKYRADFLLTLANGGKERSLIIEYDGVEFHTKNPEAVTAHNIDREYIEYDIQRQLELESYGYRFLRINKFSLVPRQPGQTERDVLNGMLEEAFAQ